jgi:transposase
VVDIDGKTCPCKSELHRIGEDKSERLDMVPAQFRVLVTRRPKYAYRACEGDVMQAQAPARSIEGGLSTEATVAQVLVSKYADHLPLHRQAQIYAHREIHLDRRWPTVSGMRSIRHVHGLPRLVMFAISAPPLSDCMKALPRPFRASSCCA